MDLNLGYWYIFFYKHMLYLTLLTEKQDRLNYMQLE